MPGKTTSGSHIGTFIIALTLFLAPITPSPAQLQLQGDTLKPADPGAKTLLVNANRIAPAYPIPYGIPKIESIQEVLNRIHSYLEGCTPARMINIKTNEPVTDIRKLSKDDTLEMGAFWLTSYEWGVTYSGMLLASEATGDSRFADYTAKRLNFLAVLFSYYQEQMKADPKTRTWLSSVVDPASLDDSGSMCAAMIKARRSGVATGVQPMIDNYIRYISKDQFRFEDGTLARNRPFPRTLWLDDLYMSVPALAQMGKATGEKKYYDDAARQILQFSDRMFIKEKGLYMHGWVEGMDVHPVFHWARANGWALMAKTELLEVLPENHPDRVKVLELLRAHIRGLANCQSGQGLWHQLLDRNDSYLETSASAMFAYCIARAINRGWIDKDAHLAMLQLAWNAVAARVNAQGQVEGTCIGTGLVFDPMFYYYRPTSVFAAHGYGSVLQAGAEMIRLLKNAGQK
jgi:unsaturated rhamnogalacturonyl hydrolase